MSEGTKRRVAKVVSSGSDHVRVFLDDGSELVGLLQVELSVKTTRHFPFIRLEVEIVPTEGA